MCRLKLFFSFAWMAPWSQGRGAFVHRKPKRKAKACQHMYPVCGLEEPVQAIAADLQCPISWCKQRKMLLHVATSTLYLLHPFALQTMDNMDTPQVNSNERKEFNSLQHK